MPHRVCAYCSAEFACPASFRGKNPKCIGCRVTHPQRQHAPAHGLRLAAADATAAVPATVASQPPKTWAALAAAKPAADPAPVASASPASIPAPAAGGASQNGAAGSAPRRMTPCACHCAACRAAGQGNKCVMVSASLDQLFVHYGPKDYDYADLKKHVLQHYYHGASGWDTASFDSAINSVQYGPAGDVIAAGDSNGRIHLICTQTGAKILCLKGHR